MLFLSSEPLQTKISLTLLPALAMARSVFSAEVRNPTPSHPRLADHCSCRSRLCAATSGEKRNRAEARCGGGDTDSTSRWSLASPSMTSTARYVQYHKTNNLQSRQPNRMHGSQAAKVHSTQPEYRHFHCPHASASKASDPPYQLPAVLPSHPGSAVDPAGRQVR